MTFRVVPHRIAVTTGFILFSLVTLVTGALAATLHGGVATLMLVVFVAFLAVTIDFAAVQLRPDTLTITDEGLIVVEIERTAFIQKSPARWLESRKIELAWDEVLAFERPRFEYDGPSLSLVLSKAAEERIGAARLTLPSIDEISVEQLTLELKSRQRALSRTRGVRVNRLGSHTLDATMR